LSDEEKLTNITYLPMDQKHQSSRSLHSMLEGIRQILPGLSEALGPDCEVVLHDFKDIRHSLVSIEGNITGRDLGSPLTDLILQVIRRDSNPNDLLNYPCQTYDGRALRSSTLFIRDENGALIGCLCINRDISQWQAAQKILATLCQTYPLDNGNHMGDSETFVQDVEELLMGTINEVMALEKKPIKYMDKIEKIHVVKELDARGIFLIRGSVKTVARALNVSRYTIYNYLDEGRQ